MEVVSTDKAPTAIGTYSQAVKHGGFLFISGQIPLDPNTMELVSSDAGEQIQQVFRNLKAIADEAGVDFNKAIKLTVYLTDLGLFALVNEQMAAALKEPYPARAAVEVSRLPKDALVEIDAIFASD